jgi:hypothetical protein
MPFGQVIPVTGPGVGFPGNVSRIGERVIVARQVLPTTPSNVVFGQPVAVVGDSNGGTVVNMADFLSAPAVTVNAATTNTSPIITPVSLAGLVEGMVASGTGIAAGSTIIAIGASTVTLSANATATAAAVAVTFAIPTGNAAIAAASFGGIAVRNVETSLTFPSASNPGLVQTAYYPPGQIAEVLERGSITVPITAGTPVANAPVYLRTVANSGTAGTAIGDLEAANEVGATTTMGTTIGSAVVAVASATGIAAGQVAAGAGIPAGATVVSISSSNITLSAAATQTVASGVAVTFSNTVALPGVVFRTGLLDASSMAEITLKNRAAA